MSQAGFELPNPIGWQIDLAVVGVFPVTANVTSKQPDDLVTSPGCVSQTVPHEMIVAVDSKAIEVLGVA